VSDFLCTGQAKRQNLSMAGRKKLSLEEIHALRGSLKRKPGDKPFAEWMVDLNREEKELEEKRFQRLAALSKK